MRPRDTGASRRFTRWIPAIAAPIAIGAAVVLVPLQANAAVDLPDLTPKELVEFAASSDVEALSGTVEQTSELGLPDLAGLTGAMGGAGSSGGGDGEGASASDLDDLIDLATGSHTARVYLDGSNARMQVLDRLAERDVVVTEDGAWIYDSREQAATHVTIDRAALEALRTDAEARGDDERAQLEAELGAPLPTPDEVLDQALAKLDESTDVSVGTDTRVSGREVYELVLEPQDEDTLVGEVAIAIDGENGVPLAASVTARGAEEPAFRIAFTDVSFEAPDASVFEFTPPEGTTVTEHEVPVPTVAELEQWKADAEAEAEGADGAGQDPRPQVIGEGWSAVVVLPAGEGGAYGQAADGAAADGAAADGSREGSEGDGDAGSGLDEASAMLDSLTQPVDGGRLLTTSLVSVFFADDGRVLVGAVTPERLLDAAASGR